MPRVAGGVHGLALPSLNQTTTFVSARCADVLAGSGSRRRVARSQLICDPPPAPDRIEGLAALM